MTQWFKVHLKDVLKIIFFVTEELIIFVHNEI